MALKLGFDKVGLFPDGVYMMIVAECKVEKSSKKGTPGFMFRHEVYEGEFEQKPVWDNVFVTEKGIYFLQTALRSILGGDWNEAMEFDDEEALLDWMREQAADMLGMTFQAVVGNEMYTDNNGADKFKNNITEYLPKMDTPDGNGPAI
jgi:hypothetical protein